MIFDFEVWTIAKDTERRIYCGAVDNRVAVCPKRGAEYGAFIKVPSDLFHFLLNVAEITSQQLKDRPVSIYLDEGEKGTWYLGLESQGENIDLWAYKSLPKWAYRL